MKNLKNVILLSVITGFCFSSAYARNACSNAALNKPATAVSSYSIEIPSRAVDGDVNTNWCTPGFEGWIQVDLQNQLSVDSLKLHVNQFSPGNTVHEIKISDDMENWILVDTLSGFTFEHQILTVNFHPALSNVRGVMINTISSNSWVAWYEIEVYASSPKPTIIQNGDMLTSSSTINNQWYFNGNAIPDATSQSYTVNGHGDYQVGVSNEYGCESKSEILTITDITLGINEMALMNVKMYPNPANDHILIEGVTKGKIEVLNLQGQVIGCVNIADQKTSVNLSDLTGGVYSIKITTRDGSVVKKLLKQ